jgi:hypothetical protein
VSDIIPPASGITAPGGSPLVEQMNADLTSVEIKPAFGDLLHVALHSNSGMPELVEGALYAVTVYGDGRIEYHPASTAGGAS